ncbi:MAG: asparagine synthase C-terminal domain-containing protein [Methanothrix sp.]
MDFSLRGWAELDGRRLEKEEIRDILQRDPVHVSAFGGEFFLKWNGCRARDHFGIMPGSCQPGELICAGKPSARVEPAYPIMDLDQAIKTAVDLRSDQGVVALSGGVDSALVARLAGRECVAVGLPGSHDLERARQVAGALDLILHEVQIEPLEIEEGLAAVLPVIPDKDPVNASIAATLFFVCRWAGDNGVERILAGQSADELFGGYSRYLHTQALAEDMERDFQGLPRQLARDQAVAGLFGAYFSLPYMDCRVVAAARAIQARMRIVDGVRKRPLREVAARHLPAAIAWYEKKAMQYGSGVMREIERLAARRGYRKDLAGYLQAVDGKR